MPVLKTRREDYFSAFDLADSPAVTLQCRIRPRNAGLGVAKSRVVAIDNSISIINTIKNSTWAQSTAVVLYNTVPSLVKGIPEPGRTRHVASSLHF